MWYALLIVAAGIALAILHIVWRNRLARASARHEERVVELQDQHRKAQTQARIEQETLFNSMAEGVLVLDEGGRIQLANRAFARLLGMDADVRSKTVLEALRLHEVAEIVKQIGSSGELRIGREIKLTRPSERWLEVSGAGILDPTGKRSGMVLVFHETTRLKQLENARKEFVANVSHELRTPLSLIKGYVETLLEGAKDDPETRDRFLRTIERNAERLQLLIEDLLVISELESGRVNLTLQPLSLRALVHKVQEDFRAKAEARQMVISETVPDLQVCGDAGRLEQVVCNLVDNAIKYGRVGGHVEISARALDALVEVAVRDDGPGIPPEALDRIFERFYRVDKARSREQGGTGLGLSIVKHIVQSHGGKAWATSRLGEGSTFYFTLPAVPTPAS